MYPEEFWPGAQEIFVEWKMYGHGCHKPWNSSDVCCVYTSKLNGEFRYVAVQIRVMWTGSSVL